MKRLFQLFLLLSFTLTLPAEEELSGPELAQQLRLMAPLDQKEITGLLVIRKGKLREEIPVQFSVAPTNDGWITVYQAGPGVSSMPEKLVIVRRGGTNAYSYGKGVDRDSVPETKPIDLAAAAISFAGSDFWLTDLGLQFFFWPDQKKYPGEMRLGRPCFVLESRDPNGHGGLVRIKSWIDKETGGLLIAEGYNSKNELIKEFNLSGSSFKKVNGKWKLEEMKIRSPKEKSQTLLKFHLETS
jgi:hypothetical protein